MEINDKHLTIAIHAAKIPGIQNLYIQRIIDKMRFDGDKAVKSFGHLFLFLDTFLIITTYEIRRFESM